MTAHTTPESNSHAWQAAALARLRENLRLTAAERLAVAEALLAFAIRTPHYAPKPERQPARP